jgi:polar amino acid transport system ATP-binding protein
MSIPVLDLQPLLNSRQHCAELSLEHPGVQETVDGLLSALHEVGFAYLQHHGVSESLLEELEQEARRFFALPEAEKQKLRMENAGLAWKGFFSLGAELTSGRPDQKEGLYFGTELSEKHEAVLAQTPMHGPNQWPEEGKMREVVLSTMQSMTELGQLLLEAVALGLGLPASYFAKRFREEPTRLFRIFHYPEHEWPEESDEWGVREHTDMGFLTLLKQDDSGGLQVKARDGQWWDAPPKPGTLVLNIGDMLELWTWGILKANPHRVRNASRRGRLSFPFFFDPGWNGSLEKIERSLLPQDWLDKAHSGAEKRWDGLDLQKIGPETTYGEFVWSKVKHVFPQLVPDSTGDASIVKVVTKTEP